MWAPTDGWEFHPHETGQFSEEFCSSGFQAHFTFANPSVNSNLQPDLLLPFLTVFAPSEQHTNYNIPQDKLIREQSLQQLLSLTCIGAEDHLHGSALPDLFSISQTL